MFKNTLTKILLLIKSYKKDKLDASRYRWLRKQHWSDKKMTVVSNAKDVKLTGYCPSGIILDNIIDKQMKLL